MLLLSTRSERFCRPSSSQEQEEHGQEYGRSKRNGACKVYPACTSGYKRVIVTRRSIVLRTVEDNWELEKMAWERRQRTARATSSTRIKTAKCGRRKTRWIL